MSLGKILVSWASVSLCVKGGDCPRERSRGPFRSDFLRFKNSQLSVDPPRAPAALSLWSPRDTRRTVFPGARDPPWSGGQGRGACWRLQGGSAPEDCAKSASALRGWRSTGCGGQSPGAAWTSHPAQSRPASRPMCAACSARGSSSGLVPPQGVDRWQVYDRSAPSVLGVTFQSPSLPVVAPR